MDAFSYLSVLLSVVLGGQLPTTTNLAFHGLFAAGCVSGMMLISRRRYQEGLGIAFAVALLVYIGVLFARLH